MNDWTQFKKSFTKEQEDAIWQYLIDHSKVQRNGYLGIQIYVRELDDFWRRVFARYNGDFKRYEKLEKAHTQTLTAMYIMQKDAIRKSKIVGRILKSGSVIEKLALFFYRKSRDYLFT